ncbi:MAG: hypothetical protein PHY44_02075 [Lachnospiraceae bacterium]|nr:hypothetical protein [Lachnospiraceae bacterium]
MPKPGLEVSDEHDDQNDESLEEIVDDSKKIIPKTDDVQTETQETLSLVSKSPDPQVTEVPAPQQDNPVEEHPVQEGNIEEEASVVRSLAESSEVPVPPEVVDPREIEANKKINALRASHFAKAIYKHRVLPEKPRKEEDPGFFSGIKKLGGDIGGAVGKNAETLGGITSAALTGKGALDMYSAGKDLANGKNSNAPTGNAFTDTQKKISLLSNSLLMALAIKKIFDNFKKGSSNLKNTLVSLPSALKALCMVVETYITFFKKDDKQSKDIMNYLTPSKTFLTLIDTFLDYSSLKSRAAKFEKIKGNAVTAEKLKPAIADIKEKEGSMIPKMVLLLAQTAAQLTYAIGYTKNPNSKFTMWSKFAMGGVDIAKNAVDFKYSRYGKEQKGPDEAHKNLSSQEYQEFASLSDNHDLYIGAGTETDNNLNKKSLENKENAIKSYQNIMDEFEVLGISSKKLSSAESQEEQQTIISEAVGY